MQNGKRPPTQPPRDVDPAAVPASSAAPAERATAPPAQPTFPIVALGASAGGLEAFEQFFHELPDDLGMAFVLVQHLDPRHSSILSEILQRSTRMPVMEAQDGMPVEVNHVYAIPPNCEMQIGRGVLQLDPPSEPRGQRMPIDAFFRSLAEDHGERAVGIILSGTGTDGTLGLRAIHGAGGICLVQEPATAKYDGMPSSAVRSGFASQVMPVREMAAALRSGLHFNGERQPLAAPKQTTLHGLNTIVTLLRAATGHDFSQYKKSTIGRRVERRMAQHGLDDTAAYVSLAKENPAELQALFRELLINVTNFFRDPEAFVVLQADVLPELLAGRPASQPLRVWVAGCATGEEAYSIAIVLRELMEQTQRDFPVQLYSTDLDDDAIATARAGLYPPNIAQDVTPERLRRFFVKEESGYRVRKEIREMVVFAVQSVIKDPPFTRLDLLACRNLMIYLEPELQERLIPSFHYALRPGGVLLLSPSESVGNHAELFAPIHRKWKIYRALPSVASTRAVLHGGLSWAVDAAGKLPQELARKTKEPQFAESVKRALLQSFAPASVVTDLRGNILYVHGDTGKYLRPAPGQPTLNVVEMAREGLQMALREALRLAAEQTQPTVGQELSTPSDAGPVGVGLSVRFLPDPSAGHSALLISFQELSRPPQANGKPVRARRGTPSMDGQRLLELERELAVNKESLHAALEEQQAFNEELKSTNEEMQSTNEELQSTNEELETSKEELQSVNEELVTVNGELQSKIEQMSRMQNDMKNLLDNIHVGAVFLDRVMVIKRFTRDATAVFRLVASDVGRPLLDIKSDLPTDELLADAQAVLESLVPLDRDVATAGGTHYVVRIQPYRTMDNYIDGVVLTFTDVSERLQAISDRKARALAEAIVDTVRDPLLVLDGRATVVSASRAFYERFSTDAEQTVGRPVYQLAAGGWDQPALRELLETALPRDASASGLLLEHDFPGEGPRQLRLDARRIVSAGTADELILLSIADHEPASD